ncbi:transposase [Patescibacteria group bacterium]|nr:transposase [Patescibacteria group bacterium]
MPRRKIKLENDEYYHIYNRGTDKRNIVSGNWDILRILESLSVFNTTESVGSIYEHSFEKNQLGTPSSKLVEIVAFNILGNHYHLVLRQLVDNGISKFMQSFGGGYTKHFNEKRKRSGVLFQGPFKSEHIDSDEYLNYVVAYVNLNHFIHGLGTPSSKWGMRSSWEQYVSGKSEWENKYFECSSDIVLGKFNNIEDYKKDAIGVAEQIIEKRKKNGLNNLETGFPSNIL